MGWHGTMTLKEILNDLKEEIKQGGPGRVVENRMTPRIESAQRGYDAVTDPTRICAQCIHVEVCTIFRGVNRALEWDFPNIKRPFETPDIAEICNHF